MSDKRRFEEKPLSIHDRAPEALLKRLLLVGAAAEFGTTYGKMYVRGDLTIEQYAACKWFDNLYTDYLRAIDKSRGLRTSTGERMEPGHAPDPLSEEGAKQSEKDARIVREYDSAKLAALQAGAGNFRSFCQAVIEGAEGYRAHIPVRVVSEALDKHRRRGSRHRNGRRAC